MSSTAAIILAAASLSSATPLFFSQTASAISGSEIIYNALPSISPATNYPSLGFQATSTSEFGDSIHLGGINRVLNTVTVGMSDWAKYSDYSNDARYKDNSSTWTHPVTLTVYGATLNSDGTPSTVLAQKTEDVTIPWRPASDPSCGSTSNGPGWKVGSTCYNYSGLAFNATFDMSSMAVTLPNDIIIGVSFNTQSYGRASLGQTGPYNSLNVLIPNAQVVTTGSDSSTDSVYWKTAQCAYYSLGGTCNVFREDTKWSPNGTVAFQVTATAPQPPMAPTNLAISHNGSDVTNTIGNNALLSGNVVLNFDAVPGANQYITEVTYPDGTTQDFWNGYHNTWLINNSVVSQGQFSAKGQGIYSYKVKDRNASTGLWSNWSAPVTLGYDTTKPTAAFTSATSYPKPNGYYNSDFSVGYLVHDNVMLKSVNVALFDTDPSHSNHWVANCYSNTTVGGNTATGTCTVHIPANTPDGTYYVQIGGQDMAGYWTVNATRSITIDRTAPDVPTNLSWKTTGNVVVANNGTTDEYSGTASWQDSSSDVNHYIYKYWNDISGNQYKVGTEYLATVDGTSLSGVFNQGEGVHHFCVEAVDNANNTSACSAPFTITYDATVITDNFTVNMLTGDKVTLAPTVTSQTGPLTYTWTVSDSKLLNYPQDTKTGAALVIGPAPKDTYTVTLTVRDKYGYPTVATYIVTIADHASPASVTPQVLGTSTGSTSNTGSTTQKHSTTDTSSYNGGEVLGAQTTTPSQNAGTTNASTNSEPAAPSNVETLTTNKPATITHSRFLLLGWWWLVVVAALVGFFWLLLGRHGDHDAQ